MKLKEYLWKEWRMNNHPKYYIYFEEWFENLTDSQKIWYKVYSKGLKTL